MNINKKNIITKLCISFILIITVVVGYVPIPNYMKELTFISNFLLGALFLISSIRIITGKKDFPNIIYSSGVVTIMFVFFICAGSLSGIYHMNYKGAFFFLHFVNPFLVLIYYLLYIKEDKLEYKKILLTPCFVLFYMLIDLVLGKLTGNFIYGFFKPSRFTIPKAAITGIVLYIMLVIIGYSIFLLNINIHRIKHPPNNN